MTGVGRRLTNALREPVPAPTECGSARLAMGASRAKAGVHPPSKISLVDSFKRTCALGDRPFLGLPAAVAYGLLPYLV